jgi:O-antigen/teichoic acid export membrane protein
MPAIADIARVTVPEREAPARKLGRMALRYGVSASGPVSVSGAHFVASMMFLHILARAEFGLFAFLLVIVPLCMSVSGALLGTSMATAITGAKTICADQVGTHLKLNLLFSAAATLAVFGLMCSIRAPLLLAALLGLYGGAMTLRWFGRSYAYLTNKPMRAVGADIVYSTLLMAGLAALVAAHKLTAVHAAEMLLASAALSVLAFGPDFLGRLFWPGKAGSLAAYGRIWQDITRWSLLGVMLTEMTANAHAYLVTLVSGPAAFALLAVGALLMRPVSLVLTALPDMERPVMARAIVAGDMARAFRCVKEFRTAAGAVWLLTLLLSGALLLWFPHLILKQGYDETQAIVVVAIWGAIQAVRTLRTPESVLLQAAREYRPLATVGMWSSIASLTATLVLLLAAGPVASLGGVLLGELLLTANIFSLSRKWKLAHG